MKKKQTIIVVGLLLVGLVLSGATIAAGKWDNANAGFRHHRAHGKDGLSPLTRYMHQNLVVAVLSEMSDQPADTVRQKMQDRHMRGFLEEYNIDRQAFRAAMKVKTTALVQNLAAGKFITLEQAKEFDEKMERRAERRALMNRLVEKGIEDGTITAEQAQDLFRKPF
jgi:hypothetical protein